MLSIKKTMQYIHQIKTKYLVYFVLNKHELDNKQALDCHPRTNLSP